MENIEITITDKDRKTYSNTDVKNKSLVVESDKSLEISKPLDLPRIPTIADSKVEGKLSKEDEITILQLLEAYPKTNFDNITSDEARELVQYSAITQKMSREEIWKLIKPYFPSVFGDILGDKLPKMQEIQKRSEDNPSYTPTMEWLIEISRRIIHMRKDLFKYNIDFRAQIFEHKEKPIDFLLMLIKAQREMYPKRKTNLSEAFFSKVQLLIQNHSELILKLKLINKKGEDFFGSKYAKTKDSLKILKGIMYLSFQGKPLTIKQQSLLINIIDDYKKSLDMVFIVNPDDKDFYDKALIRPKKDVKFASLETYHVFDDSSVSSKGFRIKGISTDISACEIVNSIFLKIILGKSMNVIYKNGIQVQNLEDYIKQYFLFKKSSDRYIIRQKALNTFDNTGQHKIVGIFFDILDKYMI